VDLAVMVACVLYKGLAWKRVELSTTVGLVSGAGGWVAEGPK
jgi:hypothetical protein